MALKCLLLYNDFYLSGICLVCATLATASVWLHITYADLVTAVRVPKDLCWQVAEACKKAGAPEVDILPIDMKSSKSIDTLAKTLLERHKCIDVLVNCAGIFPMTGQTPLEGVLTVNLQCVYMCVSRRNTCEPGCAHITTAQLSF